MLLKNCEVHGKELHLKDNNEGGRSVYCIECLLERIGERRKGN